MKYGISINGTVQKMVFGTREEAERRLEKCKKQMLEFIEGSEYEDSYKNQLEDLDRAEIVEIDLWKHLNKF